MFDIYRPSHNGKIYDSKINVFHGRESISNHEVVVKTKPYYDKERTYTYAEPKREGSYAYGGSIIYDHEVGEPIKLHDRDMHLEDKGVET